MNAYERAMRQWRLEYFLRAACDARGNFCAGARSIGVHRNTFTRVLHGAGFTQQVVRGLVMQAALRKKPPMAEHAPTAERRSA